MNTFTSADSSHMSQLVSWCFEPSQPQRITSGLNTNFTLSPSYSFHKSSYHKSCLKKFFFSLIIFRRHSSWEPASSRVTYFILQANTGTGVSHSQHTINRERFGKNAGEWTGRVEISKEEIPGSKCNMYIDLLKALKGERLSSVFSPDGGFNFCICSSPLR